MVMKIDKKNTFYILAFLLISLTQSVHAQEFIQADDHVRWTPDGMVIFVNDAALSAEYPVDGLIEGILHRRLEGESSYTEIARLKRADNWDEFNDRASARLVNALMEIAQTQSEDELWEFIQQNPRGMDYGFLYFEREFQKAYGLIYLDEETRDLPDGEVVSYRMTYILETGEESDERYTDSAIAGQQPILRAPRIISFTENENRVGGKWASPIEGSEDAFFANIYRQKGIDGDFERIPTRLMAVRSVADSLITYTWEESTEPETWHRFFVEPVDMVGNPGPRSDTLQVISVNFDNIPLMSNVEVADTSAGIHLSWEPISNKPYITGIEIKRSRNASSGFVVLDTLAVSDTNFLDTRVVPNRTYYYEFRVVTMRAANDLPSAIASGSFVNTEMPPPQPSGLRASREGEHIRLNWNSVQESDLYAYYVYRGTSRHDSLVVASRAITDSTTFLDTNENLDGRTNYTYAIKAVNMSGIESELSEFTVIRPDRKVQPPAPVGVSGYGEYNRIRISWRDVQRRDEAVAGYHVYRSLQPVNDIPSGTLPDGVERLTDEMITTTAFDDVHVASGQRYYYAVSSIDIFEIESELSPFADFRTSRPELSAPTQVSVRAINGQVELRWNRTHQTEASGYAVYRRTRDQSEPVALATLGVDETSFTDTSASQGTLYWYSVSVLQGEHESTGSREQSVRIQ